MVVNRLNQITVSFVTSSYVFYRWISGAAVVNAFYSSGRNQIGKVYS